MLEDEEKLIKEAKRGKAACFDQLYSHYLAPIYRFIYMKVTHREEAEDLTHEVFLNAWQNIRSYRSRGFPFSSWLYQIARNRVIDHYRLKKRQISLESPDLNGELLKFESPLEQKLDQELTLEKVRTALLRLTFDQQDIIIMRFMEELSYEEIAAAMKKSQGAVRLIQHRALNRLKELLNGR